MEKNNNLTLVILLIIVFVIGFLGGSLWTENKNLKAGNTGSKQVADTGDEAVDDLSKNVPEVTDADHIRGNKDAKIVLIEYSDYECPYCNRFHPTMLEVMDNYGDDVAWVYRHFPLSFHPHAQILAEASECVAEYAGNDAFWAFSDSVYSAMADDSIYDADGENISQSTIVEMAVATGANQADIESCLDNGEMTAKVKEQAAGGTKAGVTGTPGTIIVSDNGFEKIPGALSFTQVEQMLQNHL
jgi:protein-disulfide isomerase